MKWFSKSRGSLHLTHVVANHINEPEPSVVSISPRVHSSQINNQFHHNHIDITPSYQLNSLPHINTTEHGPPPANVVTKRGRNKVDLDAVAVFTTKKLIKILLAFLAVLFVALVPVMCIALVRHQKINGTSAGKDVAEVQTSRIDDDYYNLDYEFQIVNGSRVLVEISSSNDDECTGFQCISDGVCVPNSNVCNRSPDCLDGSDEKKCSCVDYLKAGDDKKICDSEPDCADFSDESECVYTCGIHQYQCKHTGLCIYKQQVCDGINDCFMNDDELFCARLSDRILNPQLKVVDMYRADGFLFMRKKGIWYPFCGNFTRVFYDDVCGQIGYRSVKKLEHIRVRDLNISMSNFISASSTLAPSCSGFVTRLQCRDYECGKTPGCPARKSRIVGGNTASVSCFPFLTDLYRNGYPKCSGILLNSRWIMTAGHCFIDERYRRKYRWSARVGFTSQHSHSPYEQVSQVGGVVLHPNYTNIGQWHVNDIALLQLVTPIHFNDHVQPVCLLQGNTTYSDPPVGTGCKVLGYGSSSEGGSTLGMLFGFIVCC